MYISFSDILSHRIKKELSASSEGLCDLFSWRVARGRRTHEGNKSHNHELKADKRLIFHWRGFLKGCKNTLKKIALLFIFFLFFNTLCWHWWDSQVSRLFNYVSGFLKLQFEKVVCLVRSEC